MLLICLLCLIHTLNSLKVIDLRIDPNSDVVLRGDFPNEMKLLEWEFDRFEKREFVLQYYSDYQSPTIYPKYKDRVELDIKLNTLILKNITDQDEGNYTHTMNLNKEGAIIYRLRLANQIHKKQECMNSTVINEVVTNETNDNSLILTLLIISILSQVLIMILIISSYLRFWRVNVLHSN